LILVGLLAAGRLVESAECAWTDSDSGCGGFISGRNRCRSSPGSRPLSSIPKTRRQSMTNVSGRLAAILHSRSFALQLLGTQQRSLAGDFASRTGSRFRGPRSPRCSRCSAPMWHARLGGVRAHRRTPL